MRNAEIIAKKAIIVATPVGFAPHFKGMADVVNPFERHRSGYGI